MDAQVRWLEDGVVRGAGQRGGPARDLVGAPVLRAAVQRHEPDGRPELADLLDPGERQQLGQVHAGTLYFSEGRPSRFPGPVVCMRRMLAWYARGAIVRAIGASRGSRAALMSMRVPPIRSAVSAATPSAVRRTALGGSDPPSSLPDSPMAVGTHPGYRTCTRMPLG